MSHYSFHNAHLKVTLDFIYFWTLQSRLIKLNIVEPVSQSSSQSTNKLTKSGNQPVCQPIGEIASQTACQPAE